MWPRCSRRPPNAAFVRQGIGLRARRRRVEPAPGLLRGHAREIEEGVKRLAEAYRQLAGAKEDAA